MPTNPLPQLRAYWSKYRLVAYGLVALVMLWTLRRLMKPVATPPPVAPGTSSQTPAAGGYTVQAHNPQPVQAASGISSVTALKRAADATALAYAFGTDGSKSRVNQAAAFTLLKREYSRLLLHDNKPFHNVNGKYVGQAAETSDSLKRGDNWTVLAGDYRAVTGGNDLRTDIRKYLTDKSYQALLKWII